MSPQTTEDGKPIRLTAETELMYNQKHATVLSPTANFQVVQTTNGHAIYFSLGTDGVLYVTEETPLSKTGWVRKTYGENVQDFDVAQNEDGSWSLAVITQKDGQDHLFCASQTNSQWTEISCPLNPVPAFLGVKYLYGHCFVDVARPFNNGLTDRYAVDVENAEWILHRISIGLQKGIQSVLGQRADEDVPGLYTMGVGPSGLEMIYEPIYNAQRKKSAVSASRFSLPKGANTFALATAQDGTTTRAFVAGYDGIYLYQPDNQLDGCQPSLCISSLAVFGTHRPVYGVRSLYASSCKECTSVWGVNHESQLFYATVKAGQEADPGAWSTPLVLAQDVIHMAFYLNSKTMSHTVFVHQTGDHLNLFTQEPKTGVWTPRPIMLPPADVNDMIEYSSFTTHINVLDEYHGHLADHDIEVTSDAVAMVIVNDIPHTLGPGSAVRVKTTAMGAITVIQRTNLLTASSFKVTATRNNHKASLVVDPHINIKNRMQLVQTDQDLKDRGVKATNSTTKGATAIKALHEATQTANIKPAVTTLMTTTTTVKRSVASGGPSSTISLAKGAAELFHFLKVIAHDVEDFAVHILDGVRTFRVTIAGAFYDALLDSTAAIMSALEFVVHKIEMAIEKAIDWLGHLFSWGDMKRTSYVLRTMLRCYYGKLEHDIDAIQSSIDGHIDDAKSALAKATGLKLEGLDDTMGEKRKRNPPPKGSDSPQSNWASHHFQNAGDGGSDGDDGSFKSDVENKVGNAFDTLENFVEREVDSIKRIGDQIRTEVFDQFNDLTVPQMCAKVAGIIGEFVLDSGKNVCDGLLAGGKSILPQVRAIFDHRIDIPVLSPLFKRFFGDDLTVINLMCLLIGVPATILLKIILGQTPFPEGPETDALIHAKDAGDFWKAMRALPTFDPPKPTPQVNTVHTNALSPAPVRTSTSHLFTMGVGADGSSNGADAGAGEGEEPHDRGRDIAAVVLDVFSFLGVFINFPMSLAIRLMKSSRVPGPLIIRVGLRVFLGLRALAYGVCYCASNYAIWDPDLINGWKITAATIAALSTIKQLVPIFLETTPAAKGDAAVIRKAELAENVLCFIEFVLGVAWGVTDIGAFVRECLRGVKPSNVIGVFGGIAFDLSSIAEISMPFIDDGTAWKVFYGQAALGAVYGICKVAEGSLNLHEL